MAGTGEPPAASEEPVENSPGDKPHHLWAVKNPIPFTSWNIHPGFGFRELQI